MAAGDRKLIFTEDGSHSVLVEENGATYHSRYGAIRESQHVFIEAGLHAARRAFPGELISILEVGFGTGLNAFMTAIEAVGEEHSVRYTAIEAHPLELSTSILLNYPDQLGHDDLFNSIQLAPWNALSPVHEQFALHKVNADVLQFSCKDTFHLIYFDAFAPEVQPELWTAELFQKLADCTRAGGLLVTYCSKGDARRAMGMAGWQVEKLKGPAGKWEIVRARKLLF